MKGEENAKIGPNGAEDPMVMFSNIRNKPLVARMVLPTPIGQLQRKPQEQQIGQKKFKEKI
jgi:hypothetical protein